LKAFNLNLLNFMVESKSNTTKPYYVASLGDDGAFIGADNTKV
jgi:hypothetical protein